MSKLVDRTGERYGRLVVLERAPDFICSSGRKLVMWKCKCDCGNITNVSANSLRGNLTMSCGCWNYIQQKNCDIKHHIHKDKSKNAQYGKLYNIYQSMKKRCYNKKNHNYIHYGARGIGMCDKWKNSYIEFKKWALSNGYSEELSIDRIDVNKGYCPENCRWATNKQQQNNKTNNKYITFNGITHTQQEWAEITGISRYTIYKRLKRNWSIEKTLITPTRKINE